MPNLIIDLEVDRVDLVDEGANSAAFIKMYKRKETEQVMEFEDILKGLKPEHKETVLAEIAKAKTEGKEDADKDLKAKLETTEEVLAKAKTDLQAVEEEVAKSKTSTEPDFEEVMKSLDPAMQKVFKSMQAQKEAAETIAKQAVEKAEQEEAVAKAAELKSLPVESTKLVEVVKGISPEVFEILKSANKAIEDGGLFDEAGVAKAKETGGTASGAWDQIEKAAQAIKEDQKVTIEKARTIAIKENPDLYRDYLKGDLN